MRKILRTASLGSNFTGSNKKTVYKCEVQKMRLNYFSLVLVKKIMNKLKTKPDLLSHRA